MITVDTNIVVRMIVEDDGQQAKAAFDLLAHDECFITVAAVIEAEWVLRSVYRWERARIAQALSALFELGNIVVEARELIVWAIARFSAGADLTDMLLIVAGRGTSRFATFDKRLAKQAGDKSPLEIVRIA